MNPSDEKPRNSDENTNVPPALNNEPNVSDAPQNAPQAPEEPLTTPPENDPVPQAPLSAPLAQPSPLPEPQPASESHPHAKARKGLVILLILVTLFAAGIVGYFVWQSMQPEPAANTQQLSTEATTDTTVDSAADIEREVQGITSELNELDSSEFEDSTLDNQTLSE